MANEQGCVFRSLAMQADQSSMLRLVKQSADISAPQLNRRVELINRVAAKVDAQRSVAAKANEHRFRPKADTNLRPLDHRRGFAQQIFAVLFFAGHYQ